MYILYATTLILLLSNGCASTPLEQSSHPMAQRLIGKTQESILQCAGTPLKQLQYGDGVIFRYYKEAPMFEESRPFLKGSIAQEHHGCWASLLLEKDKVTGVEFRPVPEETEYDHCEEIFAACELAD